jgi:galactokinase
MQSEKIFKNNFDGEVEKFYWSPGRVNIIGEHSDYHAGYVMPAAIDLGITWAVSKDHNLVSGYSEKFDEIGQFDVRKSDRTHYEWMLYLQGVVEVLKKRGYKFGGVNFAIHSTIPIGSGLSSSSSLATGFAFILNDLYDLGLDRIELAKVGCEAEWWYGTTGGIMDQFCIANGQAGKAVLLDCRALKHEYIKIPEDIEIVVFETTIRHKQIDSPFDLRKRQAKEVLKIASEHFKDQKLEALRDLTLDMLEEIKPKLIEKFGEEEGDLIFRRAKHPITENTRVMKMKDALNSDDYASIGAILYECHESLRDDYEVSCKELDVAVELGKKIEGIIGSRMIGGGFGGCTINLVKKGTAKHFAGEIEEEFRQKLGIKGNAYICNASDGAKLIVR